MMLIPPPHSFGPTENITQSIVKANYFPSSINKPEIVAAANISHNSPPAPFRNSQQHLAPEHQHMFAPRMQSDVSGFNMYAGATGPAGPGAIPSPAGYGAPTNPPHGFVPSHYGSAGIDHSPYYPALGPTGYDGKAGGNGDVWAGTGYGQAAPPYYQYDNFGSQYAYDSRYCGMDVNDGVRRKNATRESTNTLKAWLQEHKKNPYPTKGEKIMLAIITKMTLTQVSTWFANARRRLKKENKMTWVPKNRTNDSSNSSEDRRESDDKDTDERLDEDCRSDTELDEQNIKSAKSDVSEASENKSSCQFQPEDKSNYEADSIMENNQLTSSESPEAAYSDPTGRLGNPNISARLQEEQPCSQFDRREHNPHHRSIWSPVDNHKQPRTYSEYSENSRALYPEAEPGHSHGLHPVHGIQPDDAAIHHNFPMLQHSQEQRYTPTHARYSTANISGSPGSATSHSVDADDRRNECRFTSPVTNLQNWVNGVFHAPQNSAEEKPHLQSSSPSAEEATDLSTSRSHFNHSQQYMKHAPLGESKSMQYGGLTAHPFSSHDYYDQHRLLTKTQSDTIDHTNSPYYQTGLDETSSPAGLQNTVVPRAPGSTPKSCSLSPPLQQRHLPTSSALPFYENPMIGNEQRPGLPPPYIGQYQRENFHTTQTNISHVDYRHNFLAQTNCRNPGQSLTPSSAPNQILSPPALIGSNSNESSTVEYKATAQT